MSIQEAIENLEYAISGDCTWNLSDVQEEIKMAIEVLRKQIPVKPMIRTTPLSESYRCPICNCEVATAEMEMFICDNCGQYIDWS